MPSGHQAGSVSSAGDVVNRVWPLPSPVIEYTSKPPLRRLLLLGLIAGAPAILGGIIGASVTNPELSALLLGIGVGAVVQVIVQIAPAMRDRAGHLLDTATAMGIAAGLVAFYLTGLLISI